MEIKQTSVEIHTKIIIKIKEYFRSCITKYTCSQLNEYIDTIFLGMQLSKFPSNYELKLIEKQINRFGKIDSLNGFKESVNRRFENVRYNPSCKDPFEYLSEK